MAVKVLRGLAFLAWKPVRPVLRPIAWRIRGFLVGELLAELRMLREAEIPTVAATARAAQPRLAEPPPPEPPPRARRTLAGTPRGEMVRTCVHQYGRLVTATDAISDGMRLTRGWLRDMGFESEIFASVLQETEAGERPVDELPAHGDYVLLVHHAGPDEAAGRIMALAAPKIMVRHGTDASEAGRAELVRWRTQVRGAIGTSLVDALELRRLGFGPVGCGQMLFEAEALRPRPCAARPAEELTILFAGQVIADEGQRALLEAFARFRTLYSKPSRLVLLGRMRGADEADERSLRERVRALGLDGHVVLAGPAGRAVLGYWLERADLYASMSAHEGFPAGLVEAMAAGLPVVALAAGAVPVVLGSAGVVVEDEASLAAALARLADDEEARALVRRGQEERLRALATGAPKTILTELLALAGAAAPARMEPVDLRASMLVTVAGHVDGSYSLARVNRAMAIALDDALPGHAGLLPVGADEGAAFELLPADERERLGALVARARRWGGPRAVISQHYPLWVPPDGADFLASCFFWEESRVPAATVAQLNEGFDAVLAPTRAVRQALVGSGVRVPVRVVGQAPDLGRFSALGERDRVRGEGAVFTFLHVSSAFPRKGVDVLLAAWALAFARDEPVRLVIKTFPNPHNESRAQIEALLAAHPGAAEIVAIEADLPDTDVLALYEEADAVVLPSRGEGFNLPAAEAMAAGLPLIVSAAGGHLDFVGPGEAWLVEGRHAPSGSHLASEGSLWFEPDVDALAEAMRAVVRQPGEARARAARARAAVSARLDARTWAARVVDCLGGLMTAPRPPALSRLAVMTSWGVRCGVAEYAAMLVQARPGTSVSVTVLADRRTPADADVWPVWTIGPEFDVEAAASAVARADPQALLIQHQPGLIGWDHLASLLDDRRLRRRVVAVTLHNTRHLWTLEVAARTAVAASLARVTCVVHTTEDLDRLRLLGVLDVHVIAQGVPAMDGAPPAVRAAGAAPVIGAYGFLLPPKNFEALIEALPAWRESWPGVRLRMVTALYDDPVSGSELQRLREMAERLGVGDLVDWHTDFLDMRDSLARLRGCDVIVLPYKPTLESSSAALRTALASQVPVLVSKEEVFREAGEAVARLEGDVARSVASLLRDEDRRRALVEAQGDWVAARAWPVVAERVFGLLGALVGQVEVGS